MRVKRLIIRNVGLIADTTIELNKPLILFYGEIRQGKTTILNAVRWAFGGAFPADLIRHGESEAAVRLEFEGGSINREFYKAKDGLTKAREISFIRDGKPVKRPVDEIKKFLNPFLLDQDHLRKMGETERKQYFAQLFAVDTSEVDKEISICEAEARELRIKVKMYGVIDLTEIKSVDTAAIKTELEGIRNQHQRQLAEIDEKNREIRNYNAGVNKKIDCLFALEMDIVEIERKLIEVKKEKMATEAWLNLNLLRTELSTSQPPDTTELESRIGEGIATNIRAEQYQKNVKRTEQKKAEEKEILVLENRQRDLKKAKISKLAEISATSKIKELAFDEDGNFIYQGTSAGMLSGSQIMKLSEELSNLYPKDLGISLIDRAESLGKSVFLLIDRAKEEEKTILAAIVGERPAEIPAEVGVWIVEKGEVKA